MLTAGFALMNNKLLSMNENKATIEEKRPLPLESLEPQPEKNAGREWEKGGYWSRLLTGNLETVPLEVRRKAGADNEEEPAESRDYRLASCINRSWVVDHKNLPREQVVADWPLIRKKLAREMEVDDDEQEVYAALSMQQADEPLRNRARELYADSYTAALKGSPRELPSAEDERRIWQQATSEAERVREEYMPLAESLAQGWGALKSLESDMFPLPEVVSGAPGLVQAVDALAGMQPEERAKVYEVARSLEASRRLDDGTLNLGSAMLRSVRRGVADLRHSMVQGAGHIGAALTKAAGETLGSDKLIRGADYVDKRLQALHELRRVAQGEVYPVKLDEESGFAGELALDVAGAAPGAALAFMGGAGFGSLVLAGTGAAVAEARHRSPEGRQELQTAAGIVGGALQAGIYMGMSRIGAQMLNRSINNFLKARNSGIKGYSLASLNTLGALTAENAKLLLAGKAAQASELGMQELAARVDRVASNIDWESYGDNILDIETNMREAAMNLPFILIAAGRAALHHFRHQDIVLDNRKLLEEWGVDDATCRRIESAPDSQTRTELLRNALRGSRRWGGAGSLQECMKALRLLNTEYHTDFSNEQVARSFLNLPSAMDKVKRPPIVERDMSNPETVKEIAGKMEVQHHYGLDRKSNIDAMRLWDEWNQKGLGDKWRDAQQFHTLVEQYMQMHRDPNTYVPREFRLDGYYNPHKAKVVQALRNDTMNEMVNLSYRYLMNTESLGSLTSSYASIDHARKQTEKKRRILISKACECMDRCLKGEAPHTVFDEFTNWLANKYESRRRALQFAPSWLRKAARKDIVEMPRKTLTMKTLQSKSMPRQMKEYYFLSLGMRACMETLVDLMPHSADYQELLAHGYSPDMVGAHLLAQEFGDHLDAATWNPQRLDPSMRHTEDNALRFTQNEQLCNRYLQFSGRRLESTPDGQGGQLWRLQRPDGEPTGWFASKEEAVNSLAGNVMNLFLPMGDGNLMKTMRRAYRVESTGKPIFLKSMMNKVPAASFSVFDHMGRMAADDLYRHWLQNSTQYSMGLDFAADKGKWARSKGRFLNYGIKSQKGDPESFLLNRRKVETPLSLAKARFFVYWHRMLTSGWVSPESVADALVEAGEMTTGFRNKLIARGKDKAIYWNNKDGATRRRLKKLYPDGIMPGEIEVVHSTLARRMAHLNVLYFLSDLEQARVPGSVREWFYSCMFCPPKPPKQNPQTDNRVRRENLTTAEVVRGYIPRVMEIRNMRESAKGMKLGNMLREAYQPKESRRYEQGWCFAVGGASAFRSAGQTFWNLLEDPVRGWELLTPEDRMTVAEGISDLCGGRAPEAALQELGDVLQQYPGLRAYSSDLRLGGRIQRMVLDPTGDVEPADWHRVPHPNAPLQNPVWVKNGFTVEENAELPAEWAQDTRVLPALQLLSELRRTVSASPYTDEQGIWWKKERYGGLDGKYPPGLDSRWTPEAGLSAFMDFYNRVDRMGRAYGTHGQLNVCGVALGGISEDALDTDQLRHVTVYTTYRSPELQVRLMPGEPNAANPYQRKPYIVHTADGVPLYPARLSRSREDIIQSFAPLNTFESDLERSYDYHWSQHRRRRQVEEYLKELLERRAVSPEAWAEADESRINNTEMFMQLFQDNRLSTYLQKKDPTQLTRGEALAAELGRLMLLAEYGVDRGPAVEKLVEFCRNLNAGREDKQLLQTTLHRVVSPDPHHLKAEEQPRDEEDRKLDLSPEDAEYY